jgi:hypothetical protein
MMTSSVEGETPAGSADERSSVRFFRPERDSGGRRSSRRGQLGQKRTSSGWRRCTACGGGGGQRRVRDGHRRRKVGLPSPTRRQLLTFLIQLDAS